MGVLKDRLLDGQARPKLISDCIKLVDAEVDSKKGVIGLMIKGGYKAFKAVMPNIVEQAVDHLLDDFVGVLDTLHDEYLKQDKDLGLSFDIWMSNQKNRVADALLGVTDSIMERSTKVALKKIYSGLRSIAQKNVAEAVPGIGSIIRKHMG